MQITKEWLREKNACQDGRNWFNDQTETDGIAVVKKLVAEDKWQWANWTIVRLMKKSQYIVYAIFAAEQVIDIFYQKYPNDKRPRNAINAAKEYLKNPYAAAADADAAAAAAAAAAYAYAAAAYAYAAAAAAAAYAYAAAADADAAAAAAAAAAYAYAAADAASAAMKKKIIEYGIELLEADNV